MKQTHSQEEESWIRIELELAGELRLRWRHALLFWAPAWQRLQRSWERPDTAAITLLIGLVVTAVIVLLFDLFAATVLHHFLRGLARFAIYT